MAKSAEEVIQGMVERGKRWTPEQRAKKLAKFELACIEAHAADVNRKLDRYDRFQAHGDVMVRAYELGFVQLGEWHRQYRIRIMKRRPSHLVDKNRGVRA